jgi:predicted helicase
LLDRISRFEYDPDKLQKYTYRPFQNHFIYYQNGLISRPAFNTMQHIFDKQNKLLLFTRIWDTGEWSGSFVSSNIADIHSVGGQTYAVPLYLFDNETSEKTENFTSEFREFINQKYDRVFSAEQILGYIYAILHSPTYREKYAEELKINFPKILFVATVAEFEKLSALGMQLVQVHLLEEKPVTKRKLRIYGNDKKTRLQIDLVKYDKKNKWLYVAESVHISPVPVEVWEFEIGGYQVLDKWLKDRREDILSVKEVAYFLQVIEILQFTIEQMQKIDEVLKL